MNQSLDDIDAISKETDMYRLTGPEANNGIHGVRKGKDGVINIEGSDYGLYIHEIRHVGQSLNAGGPKFRDDGWLLNSGKSLEDKRNNEINAYQTQYAFDGSYPGGAISLKDINSLSLLRIRTPDGKYVYENLRDKK